MIKRKNSQKIHLARKCKRNRRFRIIRCYSNPKLRSNKYLKRIYYNKTGIKNKLSKVTLDLPVEFQILTDTEIVLEFIQTLKDQIKFKHSVRWVDLNFKNVINIDIGSISVLLSVMEELSINSIFCSGILPQDKKCRNFMLESGFLRYIKMIKNDTEDDKDLKSKNFIVKIGKKTIDSEIIGNCVKKANYQLTNTFITNRSVYTILIEITGNSIEHAYLHEKELSHWFLGINFVNNIHDDNTEKIIFTVVDNGSGVLKTIHRRKRLFMDLINGINNNSNILDGVFNKKYGSRLKKQNRNKGLPIIKKRLKENKIKNLKIITNNVFNEYSLKKDKLTVLNQKYNGTFFYFELDLTCY
ncbi:hypothetical protein [Empedobacter brevis]|uniref:hypothetical protein n=1 Tax=Empedobacter brevis TaxID=247 RepID=UPI0023F2758D|nr:hypothetical protein [Empedobacter brevis]